MLTDYTGLIVGVSGALAGVAATVMSARAQKRSAKAEDKADAFSGTERLVELLQDDNAALRAELTASRQRSMAIVEQMERDAIAARTQLHDMTKAMIGLRAIVLDEVAREAARDVIGLINPDLQREALRELLRGPDGEPVDDRRYDLGPPDGIERRGAGGAPGDEMDAGA